MAEPFGMNTPEQIATEYGGNKQKIAQAAQLGVIDPTSAVLAGMYIDRIRSAQTQEQAPQQTVAQQVFAPPGPPPQQGVPGSPPAAPPLAGPMAAAPMPRPAAPAMPPPQAPMQPPGMPPTMAAAGGGLLSLPVPDDMFANGENEFAGGGLVAFQSGGEASLAEEERIKGLMDVLRDPTAPRYAKEAARRALSDLQGGMSAPEPLSRDTPRTERTWLENTLRGQGLSGQNAPAEAGSVTDYVNNMLAGQGMRPSRRAGDSSKKIGTPTISPSTVGVTAEDGVGSILDLPSISPPAPSTSARTPRAVMISPGTVGVTAEDGVGSILDLPSISPPAPSTSARTPPRTAAQAAIASAPDRATTIAAPSAPAQAQASTSLFDPAIMEQYRAALGEPPRPQGTSAEDRAAQRREDIGMALLSAAASGLQSGSPTFLGSLGAAAQGATPVIRESLTARRQDAKDQRRADYEFELAKFGLKGDALKAAVNARMEQDRKAWEQTKFDEEKRQFDEGQKLNWYKAREYADYMSKIAARGENGATKPLTINQLVNLRARLSAEYQREKQNAFNKPLPYTEEQYIKQKMQTLYPEGVAVADSPEDGDQIIDFNSLSPGR